MNKIIKNILIIILSITLCIGSYITIDCIRLKNSKFNTKPIISIKEQRIDYENKSVIKYTGIGYTIEYLNNIEIKEAEVIVSSGYGAEFRLFSKILIWAWIE